MEQDNLRAQVAWILWCAYAGYIKAEDREMLDNWFLFGSSATDHPDDDREEWLRMADEVIAALPVRPDSGEPT